MSSVGAAQSINLTVNTSTFVQSVVGLTPNQTVVAQAFSGAYNLTSGSPIQSYTGGNERASIPIGSTLSPLNYASLLVGDTVASQATEVFTAQQTPNPWGGLALPLNGAMNGGSPPTFDAKGAGSNTTSAQNSSYVLTWSHTLNASANCIVVCAHLNTPNNNFTDVVVTCGGVQVPLFGAYPEPEFAAGFYNLVFGLMNPPTGTQTINVSLVGGTGNFYWSGNSMSFIGATGFGLPGITWATNASPSYISTSAGINQLVAVSMMDSNLATFSAFNGTMEQTWNGVSGQYDSALIGYISGQAATTISATLSGSAAWGISSVPILGTQPSVGCVTYDTLGAGYQNTSGVTSLGSTVTFGTAGAGAQGTISGSGTGSFTHTSITGNGILLFVSCRTSGGTTQTTTPTATVNGVSMTLVTSLANWSSNPGGNLSYYVFGLIGGPTGTQTVAVTFTQSLSFTIESVSYQNVGSWGTPQTATGAASPVSQTVTSQTGQMVSQMFTGCNPLDADTYSSYGQTSRYSATNTSGPVTVVGDAAGAASISFTVTQNNTGEVWQGIAIPIIGSGPSWTHTVATSNSSCVIVAISAACSNSFTGGTLTASCGGAGMTLSSSINFNNTTGGGVALFYLNNVAAGTYTMAFSASGMGTIYAIYANSVSYLNVNTVTAGATNYNSLQQSRNATAVASNIGQMLVGISAAASGVSGSTFSIGVNGVSRANTTLTGSSTNYLSTAIEDQPGWTTAVFNYSLSAAHPGSTATAILTPCMGAAPSTINSPSLSPNIPWFGLSGQSPPLVINPQVTEYSTAGTFTYNIPTWMASGYYIDIVCLGAGGGGNYDQDYVLYGFYGGYGGAAGAWNNVTLQYGVDIPLTTNTISVTVGAGGGGAYIAAATAGGNSSVTITGYGSRTATGGAPAVNSNAYNGNWQYGGTPAANLFNTITYNGGKGGCYYISLPTGNGAGGGGGALVWSGNAWYPYAGMGGTPGAVWITAYTTAGQP